ncbi:acyltransferase family protein [Nocardioides kribbensis]|uniref:acyltransferase family protein n=1 Tax=Nocardioides kribbensis TaxID=305517 RepID=UPI00187AEAD4|nr:acyltransferase family protein [Nocardioides kribbensis]
MASRYRSDVQGLRAVAVLVVIAAHAGVPFLPGGFVGVDVFFVVSGFLISGLLFREMRRGETVSLTAFWSRRARRILPAATLVTALTVLASVAWMSLIDAREVVVDAVWATLFAANVRFADQGDYFFAQDGPPSPMQHYWSLAVEEQFYVVWPVLLVVCALAVRLVTRSDERRLPERTLAVVLVALTAASFAWSVAGTAGDSGSAYYSTLGRAWELGAGALAALAAPRLRKRMPALAVPLLGAGGLLAVGLACVLYSSATAFPGWAALLPVLGTVALLLAGIRPGPRHDPVRALLTWRPVRVLGDWSYSLYLWHWPALILAEEWALRPLTGAERALVLLVVLSLAALTFRFVETPFRQGLPPRLLVAPRPLLLYPLSLAVVAASCVGGWQWIEARTGQGDVPAIAVADPAGADSTVALVRASVNAARDRMAVPSELDPNLLTLRDSVADVGACDYEEDVQELCLRGDPDGERTVVVTGDSHARAWIPAVERIAVENGWRAYYLVKPQCPAAHVPVAPLNERRVFTECTGFQDWVVDQVEALQPDLTIVSSSPPVNGVWIDGELAATIERVAPVLEEGYDELFDELHAASERVLLIKDVPKSGIDPGECLTTGTPSLGDCMFQPVERAEILGDVAVKSALLADAEVVDPTPWLCYQGECPVVIGGTLSYRDTDHLTTEYSELLAGSLGRATGMTD